MPTRPPLISWAQFDSTNYLFSSSRILITTRHENSNLKKEVPITKKQ